MLLGVALSCPGAFALAPWGLVNVSVANLREAPGHASEMGSQVVMGTPLRLLSKSGDWYKVEAPDGYTAYMIGNSIVELSDEEFKQWKRQERVVVTGADQIWLIADGSESAGEGRVAAPQFGAIYPERVCDLLPGAILVTDDAKGCDVEGAMVSVCLPDGRKGQVDRSGVISLNQWARQSASLPEDSLFVSAAQLARSMMGEPYLWGGTSVKSVDCSGLIKVAWLKNGVILPRNASQQAVIGKNIDHRDSANFRPGDLLFFGNAATGRVNHVGMYLGDDRFIHCSGRVRINSLSKDAADYMPLNLLGVRRLDPATLASFSAAKHSWFF